MPLASSSCPVMLFLGMTPSLPLLPPALPCSGEGGLKQ